MLSLRPGPLKNAAASAMRQIASTTARSGTRGGAQPTWCPERLNLGHVSIKSLGSIVPAPTRPGSRAMAEQSCARFLGVAKKGRSGQAWRRWQARINRSEAVYSPRLRTKRHPTAQRTTFCFRANRGQPSRSLRPNDRGGLKKQKGRAFLWKLGT